MKRNIVQSSFCHSFGALGSKVAKYPSWFIICPIFLSFFLATGFQRIQKQSTDAWLLSLGNNSKLHEVKVYIEKTFPTSNDYDPSRSTSKGRFSSIIVTSKKEGSVLTKKIFNDVGQLDFLINNIAIQWDEKKLKYRDLCARQKGTCLTNRILTLGKKIDEFEGGLLELKYPLNFSVDYDELATSVMYLGDVEVDENNYVKAAKALRLSYHLNSKSKRNEAKAQLWEDLFIRTLKNAQFQYINIYMHISRSIQQDIDDKPKQALPYFPLSVLLMIVFSVLTSSSPDWHRSKPWIGVITMMSSGLAIISGFGLVTYCGVMYSIISNVIPFLVLGIGMDDTFVMLSAWMRTDNKKSVVERLSKTYSETGLSITITSLTNFLSFFLGRFLSPFESVRAFCITMCASIGFDYLYQITFVGAMLALYGRGEERGLHSLTFCSLRNPGTELHQKITQQQPNMITRISRKIFKDMWTKIGESFTKWYIKLLILIIYLVYVLTSLWGCSKLKEDSELKEFSFYNSHTEKYLDAEYKYFYKYRDRIQIIINATLDYSDPSVQRNIETMMNTFESSPLLAPGLRESWLKSYLMFINHKSFSPFLKYYNLTSKEDFLYILRTKFLNFPRARIFKRDLLFNNNNSAILSSRFLCQTEIIRSDTDYREKTVELRNLVKAAPYPVVIYHPMFYFFEDLDMIKSSSPYTLVVITLTMAIVCLIFLPDIISAVCVSCTVLSVGVGILGYMALWGVGLNPTSVALLITVSGLSIDYAAHVSCAYFSLEDSTPNERISYSLSAISMPIFQASATTILCVAAFLKPLDYSYMLAGKIVFLVCLLGAIHAILFLPIILSLLHAMCYNLSICFKQAKKTAGVFKVNE